MWSIRDHDAPPTHTGEFTPRDPPNIDKGLRVKASTAKRGKRYHNRDSGLATLTTSATFQPLGLVLRAANFTARLRTCYRWAMYVPVYHENQWSVCTCIHPCMCVCVCMRMCVCVCVCVCVWERQRESAEWRWMRLCVSVSVCVCVHACACVRKREPERVQSDNKWDCVCVIACLLVSFMLESWLSSYCSFVWAYTRQ